MQGKNKTKQNKPKPAAVGSLFKNSVTKQGLNRFRQYLDRTMYSPSHLISLQYRELNVQNTKSLNGKEATLQESLV